MSSVLNAAVPVALGAVVLVLLFGFVNMFRGGSPNLSQKLMRWQLKPKLLRVTSSRSM